MKKYHLNIAIGLIAMTIVLHIGHYMIFRDFHHMMIFFVGDIAFVPFEVLLVTLVLDRGIEKREKEHMIEKLNIMVGLFFDEVGTNLLKDFASHDPNIREIDGAYTFVNSFLEPNFDQLYKKTADYENTITISDVNLKELMDFLSEKKDFMIQMLSNPSLLEHEEFTELIQALFHLGQELHFRNAQLDQSKMQASDVKHLKGDIERVYGVLSLQWVKYMKHLNDSYPFLYYTALIHNPFDGRDTDEVEKCVNQFLIKTGKREAEITENCA